MSAGASYATVPAAIVNRTRPDNSIPSSGEFLPLDASASVVTVQRSDRSKIDEIGRLALDQLASTTDHRRRTDRERPDRLCECQAAGVHRGEHQAEGRFDAADPVRREAELDRLVDLRVRGVVGGDRVRRAVGEGGEAREGVDRRAQRRIDP